jgi:hypothetical protein
MLSPPFPTCVLIGWSKKIFKNYRHGIRLSSKSFQWGCEGGANSLGKQFETASGNSSACVFGEKDMTE